MVVFTILTKWFSISARFIKFHNLSGTGNSTRLVLKELSASPPQGNRVQYAGVPSFFFDIKGTISRENLKPISWHKPWYSSRHSLAFQLSFALFLDWRLWAFRLPISAIEPSLWKGVRHLILCPFKLYGTKRKRDEEREKREKRGRRGKLKESSRDRSIEERGER